MDDCPADCAGLEEADEDFLRLPQDLTPITRLVLTRIYYSCEATIQNSANVAIEVFRKIMDDAFERFSLNMNLFATSQKAEMKQFIETLLRDPEGQHAFESMHRTSCPVADVQFKPQTHPQLEAELDVRQVFTNHLRELNHILCGREMANDEYAVGCEI